MNSTLLYIYVTWQQVALACHHVDFIIWLSSDFYLATMCSRDNPTFIFKFFTKIAIFHCQNKIIMSYTHVIFSHLIDRKWLCDDDFRFAMNPIYRYPSISITIMQREWKWQWQIQCLRIVLHNINVSCME